jgi:hypothetical protein
MLRVCPGLIPEGQADNTSCLPKAVSSGIVTLLVKVPSPLATAVPKGTDSDLGGLFFKLIVAVEPAAQPSPVTWMVCPGDASDVESCKPTTGGG